MINLAFASSSNTYNELSVGLDLPCDIFAFEKAESALHLDMISNRAFLRELRRGQRFSKEFIAFAKLNVSSDVFDTQKRYLLALNILTDLCSCCQRPLKSSFRMY
jgi:hypothetical protein